MTQSKARRIALWHETLSSPRSAPLPSLLASLSLFALLAVPGPTNALLLAFAATRPVREGLRALLAAGLGYGVALTLWSAGLSPLLRGWPLAFLAVKAVALALLLRTAFSLWRQGARTPSPNDATAASAGTVFLASLTNPKALVIATLFWPQDSAPGLPWIMATALALIASAALWLALGRLAALGTRARPQAQGHRLLCRGCALMLGLFATVLLVALVPSA